MHWPLASFMRKGVLVLFFKIPYSTDLRILSLREFSSGSVGIGSNSDPDPAFYPNADPDPDPRSQTYAYADPCRSGSGSWSDLKVTKFEFFFHEKFT
jgi:hypothetical protein